MKNIRYEDNKIIDEKKIVNLYDDVGWKAYTDDLESLLLGMKNSLDIISAWHKDELVGLIRVVGDGQTIVYIQDILLLESYQGMGIGSALLNKILEKYKTVRQKILLTDKIEKNINFYEKNSMKDVNDLNCLAFMHIE